jgi:hypothetical protein
MHTFSSGGCRPCRSFDVSSATTDCCGRMQVDGKPVGPQRVWPGGLAMGRTLGDASAGSVVTCEPEARQVLPQSKKPS